MVNAFSKQNIISMPIQCMSKTNQMFKCRRKGKCDGFVNYWYLFFAFQGYFTSGRWLEHYIWKATVTHAHMLPHTGVCETKAINIIHSSTKLSFFCFYLHSTGAWYEMNISKPATPTSLHSMLYKSSPLSFSPAQHVIPWKWRHSRIN